MVQNTLNETGKRKSAKIYMPSKTVKLTGSKGTRPNRRRLKKQVTVRIDEDLLKAAIARAEDEGLRMTDAIESGLWLWLQRRKEQEHVLRGRFLWNVMPMDLQQALLGVASFLGEPWESPAKEDLRKYIHRAVADYREGDPEYAPRLDRIGRGGPEDRVNPSQ